MPFAVPKPPSRRRGRGPRPQQARPEGRLNHPPADAEALDLTATAGIDDVDADLEITDDLLTLGILLDFASQLSVLQGATEPLMGGSFDYGGAPGDTNYVAGAQRDHGANPARSDLGGLAPNAYRLGIDVGAAFGIKPGSIGGRAYRPYRSDHTTGHARDIPGSGDRGSQIAEWVIQRAGTYLVKYVIFNYRIWYPGKGWRSYNPSGAVSGFASDAGHVRHVHVSVY